MLILFLTLGALLGYISPLFLIGLIVFWAITEGWPNTSKSLNSKNKSIVKGRNPITYN